MNPFTSDSLDSLRPRTEHDRHLSELHLDTGDDYRIHPAEFVEQAKRDPEHKRHLVAMAKSWLRLADRADKIQALMDRSRFDMLRNPNLRP
jgi:hypothetical protein